MIRTHSQCNGVPHHHHHHPRSRADGNGNGGTKARLLAPPQVEEERTVGGAIYKFNAQHKRHNENLFIKLRGESALGCAVPISNFTVILLIFRAANFTITRRSIGSIK